MCFKSSFVAIRLINKKNTYLFIPLHLLMLIKNILDCDRNGYVIIPLLLKRHNAIFHRTQSRILST